jgi:hypothetical protein
MQSTFNRKKSKMRIKSNFKRKLKPKQMMNSE